MKCAEPPYEFCEYLDGEYKETDICIRHKGAYDNIIWNKEAVEDWLTEVQLPIK